MKKPLKLQTAIKAIQRAMKNDDERKYIIRAALIDLDKKGYNVASGLYRDNEIFFEAVNMELSEQ